jgi:hypothetical protein
MLSNVALSPHTACLLVVIPAVLGLAVWPAAAAPAKPTTVVVLANGDDGLTQRLRDAIEGALKSSGAFTLSVGPVPPGTLVVRIPTNVPWKQIGSRTKVLYTVRFEQLDGQVIGKSEGSCWDGSLKACATRIVKDGKSASATSLVRESRRHDK